MRPQGTARPLTVRFAGTAAAALVAAGLLAGCGSSSGGGAGTTAGANTAKATGAVQAARTDAGTVLVDPRGRTLYAFAADTKGHSVCTGSCAGYWPPTPASALPKTAPAGVTASFGEISRSDGSRQLTVDGFPVYTYAGDSRPGQAAGQGLNESGGLWWVLSPSGSWVKDAQPSSSAPDNGGGYGY
jgi:predicted lipoprotein with Yx(FWY)xxD motif